jgi:hypothetical protein
VSVSITPVEGLPEIREGDDLAALIVARAALEDGDVLVVAQKVVSKAEGRVVRLADVVPSEEAAKIAADSDPRQLEVILRETARIVRVRPPLVIAETKHGFVCASAGVDASNAPEPGTVVLLPADPDASAARLRDRLRDGLHKVIDRAGDRLRHARDLREREPRRQHVADDDVASRGGPDVAVGDVEGGHRLRVGRHAATGTHRHGIMKKIAIRDRKSPGVPSWQRRGGGDSTGKLIRGSRSSPSRSVLTHAWRPSISADRRPTRACSRTSG